MILDQQDVQSRRYGATNALRTNFDPMYERWILRRYKRARQHGCPAYDARTLIWECLWVAHLANTRSSKITFISHLDRPRKATA